MKSSCCPPSRLLALLPNGVSSSPASLLPLTFCLHSFVSCPCYSTPPLCRENALGVISSTSTLWTCTPTRMHEAESGKKKGRKVKFWSWESSGISDLGRLKLWQNNGLKIKFTFCFPDVGESENYEYFIPWNFSSPLLRKYPGLLALETWHWLG